MEQQRGRTNVVKGQVVSDKGSKTISVLIYRLMKHPKYKKYIRRKSIFKVHDEKNQAKKGDVVKIYETRPVSKTKRWKLLEIISSSGGSFERKVVPEEDTGSTDSVDGVVDSTGSKE